jgi:hypothetical protein
LNSCLIEERRERGEREERERRERGEREGEKLDLPC